MKNFALGLVFLLMAVALPAQSPITIACQSGLEKYYPLVKAIYARMGLDCVFIELPSERALVEVNAGNYDAEIGRTAKLDLIYGNLIYTQEPIIVTGLSGWAIPGTVGKITSNKDLNHYAIGILRGNKASEAFLKLHSLDAESVSTIESLSNMLKAGRIQIVIMPEAADSTLLDRVGTKIDIGAPRFPIYHIFSKQNFALSAKWDQALRAMKADGKYGNYLK